MKNLKKSEVLTFLSDPKVLKTLLSRLKDKLSGLTLKDRIRILEFCGGHTHVILRHGIDEALGEWIEFVHGPGCPVCVIAQSRIDYALSLAEREDVILATYGDLIRIPGSNGLSLQQIRAKGKDVRIVDSSLATITIAKENPSKKVIFFAIGFETTTPHTAFLAKRIKEEGLKNLLIVSNHVISTEILDYLLIKGLKVDGIIAPGHVSAIIGAKPWQDLSLKHQTPMVVAGFEPFDILHALEHLVDLIKEKNATVEVQYKRVVKPEGNVAAQRLVEEVFEVRDIFPWRGFGYVPRSAYKFKEDFSFLDAEVIFPCKYEENTPKGCLCGVILQGKAKPWECMLFGRACTPKTPVGPCMVSNEGACLAYFKYRMAP